MLTSTTNQNNQSLIGHTETQRPRSGGAFYGQSSGLLGLRKYRLTGLFLLVSTMIFASVALAINITTTQSEEEQIVLSTTAASIKDAKVVARIVTDLLDSSAVGSNLDSAQIMESASSLNLVDFLTDSEIVGLNLYLPDGATAWSSSARSVEMGSDQREIFENSLSGSIASGLVQGTSVTGPSGIVYDADVVETYVPISDFETGSTAFVLGVTRDVTTALSASIRQSRSAIFRSTAISLGTGFLVLLITVFIADIRMWKQRVLAINSERAMATHELSVAKMNLANWELRQISSEREKILSTVSHELKTPLTSMIAFTDIVSRNQTGEKASRNMKHLAIVKRSGDHLLTLINDLLSSNRMGSMDTALQRDRFEAVDLFDDLRSVTGPILAAKRQTLAIEGVREDQMVQLDRRRMVQGLSNLVSNSSKFSAEGSIVLVESNIEESEIQIFIADPGIGISDEKLAEMMSVDADLRSDQAQDLGFQIARDIIGAHNGRLSIQSQSGQGTRVNIAVPIGDAG